MEPEPQSIRDRLQQLSKNDSKRQVFGAAAHDYILNPPLDADEIAAFEAKHGISLPEDYRLFITDIGNGGAGPAYGLFPFGQQDNNFGLRSWEGGDLVGDVGQPFAHSETWNLDDDFWEKEPDLPEGVSEEEEDRLWEEWDKVLEAKYWNPAIMNGAIPVCHLGCAQRQWLVVHGAQRGFVWDDMRADHAGLAPVTDASGQQMTFADWYMAWLDEAERGGKRQTIDTVPYRQLVPRSRWETLTLFLLIVAGVLLGLAIAIFRS